ncbi:response regulator transcription factor [Niabella insulamsoli]|uniref:response regulator transcription factor n=1 Tax=Niabella insulamsoli TaxID=3144874 RepID=UPI0031FC7B20
MKVLIIEDERSLALEMEHFLKKERFTCDLAFNGKAAREIWCRQSYDFFLLDIGLPDISGLRLLKEIRLDHAEAGIIMITAKGDLEDRIQGLDLGADDYLPKPFSLLEMRARINAVGRRKFQINDFNIQLGGFVIDTRQRTLAYNAVKVELSKKEFDLLSFMALNKNRPLTRLQISEHLWPDSAMDDYDSNYIDVHIKNIRKKLQAYEPPDWLETVRGIGYKIHCID